MYWMRTEKGSRAYFFLAAAGADGVAGFFWLPAFFALC